MTRRVTPPGLPNQINHFVVSKVVYSASVAKRCFDDLYPLTQGMVVDRFRKVPRTVDMALHRAHMSLPV